MGRRASRSDLRPILYVPPRHAELITEKVGLSSWLLAQRPGMGVMFNPNGEPVTGRSNTTPLSMTASHSPWESPAWVERGIAQISKRCIGSATRVANQAVASLKSWLGIPPDCRLHFRSPNSTATMFDNDNVRQPQCSTATMFDSHHATEFQQRVQWLPERLPQWLLAGSFQG